MNPPYRVGDRYRCFIVTKPDRGYGGPYGQQRRWTVWSCEECGYTLNGDMDSWAKVRAADHHEHGHAPCDKCGQMLARRKDGSPRQHAHNKCPGKNAGYKIEREFAKNIERSEYA